MNIRLMNPHPITPAIVFDQAQTDLGFRRWSDQLEKLAPEIRSTIPALSNDATNTLAAIFSASPYLTEIALSDPEFTINTFENGPDHEFHRVLTGLRDARKEDFDQAGIMRLLRQAKKKAAFAIAAGDLSGLWQLDHVTGAISALAEAAVQVAVNHSLRLLAKKGLITIQDDDNPAVGSGYTVLAMGKLGAGELNYSSDIDLIVLFDPEKTATDDTEKLRQGFIRITKDLIKIMQERTRDGYVFRTDLRLRPDPNSTPIAVSVQAAEAYYESVGLAWERAAMIKARPIAGDIQTGEDFLLHIRPFIWRKFLDFGAIEDIHTIKRRINAHRGHDKIANKGHDIKVGRGGIREIEFFAQTQQLIWGGRNWTLRTNRTLDALQRLATEGLISMQAERDMRQAYVYLRTVEHRLQMINDAQTQQLPDDDDGFKRLAAMLGYANPDDFSEALSAHLTNVENHYVRLFEDHNEPAKPIECDLGTLAFSADEKPNPEDLAALEKLGFKDAAMVARTMAQWSMGGYRATRSQRAQNLLKEVTPQLLTVLGETTNPDQAFLKFNEFLEGLPAGVQLFSLFRSNPGLLRLVADIMGSAPRLADILSKQPYLLDSVLDADFFETIPTISEMQTELQRTIELSRSFEEMLDYVRRWRHDRMFQIGVLILRQAAKPEITTDALSDIADCCVKAILPRVEAEFAAKHGRIPGARFAIVGMGKLGSREMSPASDLDLVMVYDLPQDNALSDGDKPLSGDVYFGRLSQRVINAISAPTAEGQLYEVDMRLRPSGNAGPIAAKLATLKHYYQMDAWDWEFMALTRARPIAGDFSLQQELMRLYDEVLRYPRDPEILLENVANMRQRMNEEHGTANPWRIKHVRGGIVDIEFLTQYLLLREGHDHPETLVLGTAPALEALLQAGALTPDDYEGLIGAHRLWQSLQSMLRLTVEDRKKLGDGTDFPAGLRLILARLCSSVDFNTLQTKITDHRHRVEKIYQRLVADPASQRPETKEQNGLNKSSLLDRPAPWKKQQTKPRKRT